MRETVAGKDKEIILQVMEVIQTKDADNKEIEYAWS